MKRTVSLAVLGLAVASASAVAGDLAAAPERGAGRPERAAEHREGRSQGPSRGGARGDAPRAGGDRGRDRAGERRGNESRDGRRVEPRVVARDDARDPRRDDRRDERRGERRDDRGDDRRGEGRADRDWGDSRRGGGDDRGFRNARPYSHAPVPRGWRDERGRDWRYSRDWYDRYRAEHFRYDRGRYLARQRFSIGIYYVPRGYAPRYWQRGQWLPSSYYIERRYHLADYWRFDLYDPPFGARWVRVGSDALLIDYGSGEVLDVVFELFW